MKRMLFFLVFIPVFVAGCAKTESKILDPVFSDGFIVDHLCTDITEIPESAIQAAKTNLHIAYGHTSHGSQIITGMNALDAFMGGEGLYTWNEGGSGGALDHKGRSGGQIAGGHRFRYEDEGMRYCGVPSPVTGKGMILFGGGCGAAGIAGDTVIPVVALQL